MTLNLMHQQLLVCLISYWRNIEYINMIKILESGLAECAWSPPLGDMVFQASAVIEADIGSPVL